MEENQERQQDELSTLESICGENEFSYSIIDKVPTGYAYISVDSSPIDVLFLEPKSLKISSITISYLPPIRLNFQMPNDYPKSGLLKYTISCNWLSGEQLVKLCNKLDEIWNLDPGEEVLYKWMQFLKHEAMTILEIKEIDLTQRRKSTHSENDKENIINYIENNDKTSSSQKAIKDPRILIDNSDMLITNLKEYNEKCLLEEFNLTYVYCEICFVSNSGAHSVKFSCDHAFCKLCVTEYLLTKIKDGNVIGITCPAIDCKQEISITQIKNLISTEHFLKFEKLMLNQALDTMMDIIYCPRVVCQYPVTYNPSEAVASCPNCLYSFCILCKRVYHGVEPCKLKQEDKREIIEKYQTGTEEYRQEINKRYGEKYIKRLLEDHASEETINNSTKPCPKCQVQIEKSEGCNKMTCNRCQTFFCYLCSSVLDKGDPYDHFANPASRCYNKLFPHERTEDDDLEDMFNDDLLF
uniref:RBR-type E3 ubiquitin transferase n=1 Tax=Xenopsylla cheopis TaxID=163159 RepID=A0A6M2DGF5_XENCH